MGSGSFGFKIMDMKHELYKQVDVVNSQIEIDAAYEGVRYLSLFEAKRDLSEDFLIRQLYYPYRVWQSRVRKEVKPIFLVYSNGIYRLYQYKFENLKDYNSLVLVKQKSYTIEDTSITSQDIQRILFSAKAVTEHDISFPQANSFERIINLCELLNEHSLDRNMVTEKYAFNPRQTNYYTDAARYLGLIEKEKNRVAPIYSLSKKGKSILIKGYKQRQLEFCSLILCHKIFADVLRRHFETGVMPQNDEIIGLMRQENAYNIRTEATYNRRASTVRSWIEWIIGLITE